MSALSNDILGTGAMLARLVQLGARCGLAAEATLQHVLDGAPLPAEASEPSEPSRGLDALRDELVAATADELRTRDLEFAGEPVFYAERGKREQIADLYGSTNLKYPAIANRVGSTRKSVSFFVRQLRAKRDPRILRGDITRGINYPGAPAPVEAPMAVDGVGEDCATALLSQSDDILPAGSNGEGGRADPVPDVSPEGAHEGRGFESRRDDAGAPASSRSAAVAQAGEVAPPPQVSFIGIDFGRENPPRPMKVVQDEDHADLGGADDQVSDSPEGADDASDDVGPCFCFPEASRPEMQDLLDELNHQSFARELGLTSVDGNIECAERDAGISSPGGIVAASPAPQLLDPAAGDVSQSEEAPAPSGQAPLREGTADRPAGPGETLPEADRVADVGNEVTASGAEVVGGDPGPAAPHHAERPGDEGIDSESTLTSGESAAEEAGSLPPDSTASSPPSSGEQPAEGDADLPNDVSAAVLTLFRDTTAPLGEIAARAGATNRQAGAIIASGRRRQDPRVVAGDKQRGKAVATKPAPLARVSMPASPAAADETITAQILRLWSETLKPATAIADEVGWPQNKVAAILSTKRKRGNSFILAGDAARTAANAQRAEAPRQAPAPKDDGAPGDLVLLGTSQVLTIDRGWIVGPNDSRKGFPLINSVLAMLAGGEPIEAEEIARETGARTSGAVLKQLDHWKADLAAIGVDVVRVGGSVVQLRRSA